MACITSFLRSADLDRDRKFGVLEVAAFTEAVLHFLHYSCIIDSERSICCDYFSGVRSKGDDNRGHSSHCCDAHRCAGRVFCVFPDPNEGGEPSDSFEGNELRLLTVLVDGKHWGLHRYEKDNSKESAPRSLSPCRHEPKRLPQPLATSRLSQKLNALRCFVYFVSLGSRSFQVVTFNNRSSPRGRFWPCCFGRTALAPGVVTQRHPSTFHQDRDPARRTASFYHQQVKGVILEHRFQVFSIGSGIKKVIFSGIGIKKAAHCIEFAEVRCENIHC